MFLTTRRVLAGLLSALLCLLIAVPAGLAIAPSQLGSLQPDDLVLDDADVFSRASRSELEARLRNFSDERVDARLITVRRLDYGYSLDAFGNERSLTGPTPVAISLLMSIETQNKRAAWSRILLERPAP